MNKTLIGLCVFIFLVLLFGTAYGYPKYNVWRKQLVGEAELKQASWNRKIAIEEAEAKKEAAKSLAIAEVERAKGVAQANQIIGDSLTQNEAYLKYLWIMGLQNEHTEVIYIPTEGNIPIMEAGRSQKVVK